MSNTLAKHVLRATHASRAGMRLLYCYHKWQWWVRPDYTDKPWEPSYNQDDWFTDDNLEPLRDNLPVEEYLRVKQVVNDHIKATTMLKEAADCIGDRASERDTEEERSMAATVRAFNGMFGTELTEEQGWHFMVLLKMARSKGGDFREDDYVDGAAYFALAGECRGNDG